MCLQVHWGARCSSDLRQHSRPGEQAAAALPAAPRPDAVHRRGSQRVDQRVPAPVQESPLELQHARPRPHGVWQGDAAKWVCKCLNGISICVVLCTCVTVFVYVSDTTVNHPRKCLRCYKISRELIGILLIQLFPIIQTEIEIAVRVLPSLEWEKIGKVNGFPKNK